MKTLRVIRYIVEIVLMIVLIYVFLWLSFTIDGEIRRENGKKVEIERIQ